MAFCYFNYRKLEIKKFNVAVSMVMGKYEGF